MIMMMQETGGLLIAGREEIEGEEGRPRGDGNPALTPLRYRGFAKDHGSLKDPLADWGKLEVNRPSGQDVRREPEA